jgi:hypothetical protein
LTSTNFDLEDSTVAATEAVFVGEAMIIIVATTNNYDDYSDSNQGEIWASASYIYHPKTAFTASLRTREPRRIKKKGSS